MRFHKFIALAIVLAFIFSCGNQGTNQGVGMVKLFLDRVFDKGDFRPIYNMLTSADKEMIEKYPGLKEFMQTKKLDKIPEDNQCYFLMIKTLLPMPKEILTYEIGEPQVLGDTMVVPVIFTHTEDDPMELIEDLVDENLDLDDVCEENISLGQKERKIKDAANKLRQAVKGKKFEMDSDRAEFILFREKGAWKLSLHYSFDLYDELFY